MVAACGLVIGCAGAAAGGARDAAPIADDVIEKLVREPLKRHAHAPAAAFERRLDETLTLLQRLDAENRSMAGTDSEPVSRSTADMLLGATIHEVTLLRARIRDEAAAIGDNFKRQAGSPVPGWDASVARIEAGFDRVERVLGGVVQTTTKGPRAAAIRAAIGYLRSLRDARAARSGSGALAPDAPFRLDVAPFDAPDPNPASPPEYMAWQPRPRQYALAGDTLVLAAATPVPGQEGVCAFTADDLGQGATVRSETTITPEIQALAESLTFSPARIYEYVTNRIAFEIYYGSLKGATGTLSSGAGNATDHASLLIALLRASGVPARYVKGTVQFVNDSRALRWLGAKDYPGARAMLSQGAVPVTNEAGARLTFTHVWVEACVPYKNYRGIGGDTAGHRWIPLDASFKINTYQAGISGIATSVPFDYPTFLAVRSDDLPEERYAQQVETYVKTLDPNNTVADVPYTGSAVPRLVDVLPSSLPYAVTSFTTWAGGTTSADVAEVPLGHRYQLEVVPEDGSTTEHDLTQALKPGSFVLQIPPAQCGTDLYFIDFVYCVPAVVVPVPDVVAKRVTLSFKGAAADDQAALNAWRTSSDVNAPLPCVKSSGSPLMVLPSVKFDGQEQAFASPMGPGPGSVRLCATNYRLTLRIGLPETNELMGLPDRPLARSTGLSPSLNAVVFRNLQPSNHHALLAYAFQTSDRLLAERSARLLASVQRTPDPNTNPDETEGEFLHVVGLKYLRHVADGIGGLGALHGGSGASGNHLGLTSSRMKVAYVFDEPFGVYRSGFLVDVPGGRSRNVDLATGALSWPSFQLTTYDMSALESYVWQENARLDAVSTVRGLQFAREKGIEVLTITSANKTTQLPKLTSNSDASLNYSASEVKRFDGQVTAGFTVTAPRSHIRYNNWTGAVWMEEYNTASSMTVGAQISGGYAGGYTLGDEVNLGITFTLPVPPPPVDDISSTVRFGNGLEQGDGPLVVTAADPVNMVTGNMYHIERDVAIKSRGLPIVFERSYNSRAPEDGPLGFGWTHSFNHALVFSDDNANGISDAGDTDGLTSSVRWLDGTGTEKIIQVMGASSVVPIGATFKTPSGLFFRVARNTDGTYTIREKNGLTYTFESVAGTVGQRARLLRVTDRNANALTLTYDAATSRLASVADAVGACPGAACRALTFTYDPHGRISRLTDWTGRAHDYGYDGAGNLIFYRNPLSGRNAQPPVTYAYYADAPFTHAMQRYTLPRGNGMTFEYYANGKVFRHYTTLGETTTFSYNEFRRETVAVNERGYTRRFFFDTYGNPTKLVEENGSERVYTYDAPANPMNRVSARDPMGAVTRYCYDANGNVTRVILPSAPASVVCSPSVTATSTIESGAFTAFNDPGWIKDARGNYTVFKYDTRGNLLETMVLRAGLSAPADTNNPTAAELVGWTIQTYDALGNVTSTRQVKNVATRTGPTTELSYDDPVNGTVGLSATRITRRRADGTVYGTASLAYDALGRITSGLRADWYPTQAQYDDLDRLTSATDDFGVVRRFTFDANGNLVSTVVPSVRPVPEASFTYDASDRRAASTDAGGVTSYYQYDTAGNLIAGTNPDGFTLRFEYDPNNRVIRASDQEGNAVTRTLDLDGKPRAVTDPNGNTVRYAYYGPEKRNRLKSTTDARQPTGRVTQFDYDENGNVITVTGAATSEEPAGRTTITTYDELNRPVRVAGPAYTDTAGSVIRPVTVYGYDVLGRLVSVDAGRTDRTGRAPSADVVTRQMTYGWDDFGAKITETDGAGRTWRFVPDIHGNPVSVTDPKLQITTYTYDYGGRVKTRQDHSGRLTTYDRDGFGQLRTAQSPDVTYTYAYDDAHRLVSVDDSRGGKRVGYAWSPGGLLNTMQGPDGRRTDYLYDAVGRLTGLWTPNGDLVSFIYDAAGRLAEKWLPNGVTTLYTWNPDNTLAKLVNQAKGGLISQHDYTYDDAGNRSTNEERIGAVTTPYRYTYDALSRLVEVRNNTSGALIEGYSHDALGNRTTRTSAVTTLTYAYDALTNQLTDVRDGTGTRVTGLAYDANGNLTKKCDGGTVTVSATDCTGSTVTALVYDPLNKLVSAAKTGLSAQAYTYDDQGRRIRKSVGGTSTDFMYAGPDIIAEYRGSWITPTAVYTHGPNVDDPLIRSTGADARYYHQDGLGSVVALTTAAGTIDGTARYDAWGVRLSATGAIPTYGYTGREPDETGLVYYRARYYDPTLGRFTQRDPIGFVGGINLYGYVLGNPVNATDPEGRKPGDIYALTYPQNGSFIQRVLSSLNLFGQKYLFGASGKSYIHVAMEITPDIATGERRLVEARISGGVQINTFASFYDRNISAGSSIDRYQPNIAPTATELVNAAKRAQDLSDRHVPYDTRVVLGRRDTSGGHYSCMELTNDLATTELKTSVLSRPDASTAVLPSNLSNSTTYSAAPLDYPSTSVTTLPSFTSSTSGAPYSGNANVSAGRPK
jgi:RHS repeat-associated protein